MRLATIEFTNFRCFSSEVIELGLFTSLVGPNNCGKSTALRALNIFFGGNQKGASISSDDFHIGVQPDEPLTLKFEFSDVVGEAAEDLTHYVRNERLVFELVATKDEAGKVTSVCRGIRHGLLQMAPFFAATTAAERRPIYTQIREEYPDELPAWQNMLAAEVAVRALEAARAEHHVAIPSGENAYGATGPLRRLKKYLDWIYVPAVKDASSEATELRDSAFSKLIMFAVRSRCNFSDRINALITDASTGLQDILNGANEVLQSVGGDIDREFKNLTTTPIDVSIDWDQIKNVQISEPAIKSIFRDGRVLGPPDAFGHGLQRTYLMALLSLAARVQKENDAFRLLLGIEEPELYQHPPQSRFLSNALADLSEGNCQVILTTHSPTFVSGRTFEGIRVLRKRENTTQVHSWTVDEQRAYCAARKQVPPIGAAAALSGIDRSLQTNIAELFFAGKVVLVEGPEDIAILEAYLRTSDRLSQFLRAGCHFIAAGGKTKMPMLIAIARGFNIDVFTVADFDMNQPPANQANGEIIRYAADVGDVIPQEIETDFAGSHFFGWHRTIQLALEDEVPRWSDTKIAVAQEWGWSVDRMGKDPMLLTECINRLHAEGSALPPLGRVTERIEAFWGR